MSFSPLINNLIERLQILPGVGPKTAQRMALHLLERDRAGGAELARVLLQSAEQVSRCSECRTLTENPKCDICADPRRDHSVICIVESPADVLALELSAGYRGCYFVLLGHLSPIDGIGPEDLGIDELLARVQSGQIGEVIIATNATVEGEATCFYISERLRELGVNVSRIAQGVPLGGELEYVDGGTLAHAITGRQPIPQDA